MKYKEWLNAWLNLYVKQVVKTRTFKKYSQNIVNHIIPILGDYDIEKLSPIILQKFAISLREKSLSSNTINGVILLLKSSLKKAVLMKVVKEEWSSSIVYPKVKEKKIECFSNEEQKRIENYILNNGNFRLYGIIIALYTGLRIGEILALTWEDIDFVKKMIIVNKTCYDSWEKGRYKKIIDTPKTESSTRVLPLPNQLLIHLKKLREGSRGDYVIDGRTEYGAEVRSYQKSFERLLNNLDIPHKGFHALRHTFATRAIEVGMDVKTLSEILGHHSPTITLKRYLHSMLEHKCEMMEKVGKLLIKK